MEKRISQIVAEQIATLNRSDLFRQPIVAFSSAHDPAYQELKTVIGPWHQTPTEILPEAQSVISYFVPFTKPVKLQPRQEENSSLLWSESYLIINPFFAKINDALSAFLHESGYSSSSIPATHNFDPAVIQCNWSHRSAAAISEIGNFGINRMLITEKGSAGRFCTLITSAKLVPSQPKKLSKGCLYREKGSCGKCLEVCPVNALSDNGFDKFTCQAETQRNKKLNKGIDILGEADVCGKCISVCPVGYID